MADEAPEGSLDEKSRYQPLLQLMQVIGFLIINWSQIERQLDNWVMVAFNRCGGKGLAKKGKIPKMFTAKHDFLVRSFHRLPRLAPFKDEGLRLLAEALELSHLRNIFIHGTLNNAIPTDGVFQFRRLVHGDEAHGIESFSFALAGWPALEKTVQALSHDSGLLSEKLTAVFTKK